MSSIFILQFKWFIGRNTRLDSRFLTKIMTGWVCGNSLRTYGVFPSFISFLNYKCLQYHIQFPSPKTTLYFLMCFYLGFDMIGTDMTIVSNHKEPCHKNFEKKEIYGPTLWNDKITPSYNLSSSMVVASLCSNLADFSNRLKRCRCWKCVPSAWKHCKLSVVI